MGASNVAAAFQNWNTLPHSALLVLLRMALTALDPKPENTGLPAYWGGWEELARALGHPTPERPDPQDQSPEAVEARKVSDQSFEAQRRAIAKLKEVGAVTLARRGRIGSRAKYELHLWPQPHEKMGAETLEKAGAGSLEKMRADPSQKQGLAPRKSRAKPLTAVGAEEYKEKEDHQIGIRGGNTSTKGSTSPGKASSAGLNPTRTLNEEDERARQAAELLKRIETAAPTSLSMAGGLRGVESCE